MPNTLIDFERETARMDARELVQSLVGALGTTLVATIANTTDRGAPAQWIVFGGPEPDNEQLVRLKAAHRCWLKLANSESEPIARLWFVGRNPNLDGEAPAIELRHGHIDQVENAADAFCLGQW